MFSKSLIIDCSLQISPALGLGVRSFLTAILHRGLRICFFFTSHLHFLFGLLFPFSLWSFISLFYLDIFFSIFFHFFCNSLSFLFQFFIISFLFNRGHILNFFQIFLYRISKISQTKKKLCGIFICRNFKLSFAFFHS